MVKWTFEDDCIAPQGRIKIEYRGKNPFGMVQKAKSIILRVFDIEQSGFWERDFRWDISSDPRSFYIRYYANKSLDMRSKVLGEVVFQGVQPADPNKDGALVIFIGAKLKTEFNLVKNFQKMPFYKGFLKIYNFAFYNKIRRQYIFECAKWVEQLNREFRLALNVPNAK